MMLVLTSCLLVLTACGAQGGVLPGSLHNLKDTMVFLSNDFGVKCLGAEVYSSILRKYEEDLGGCFATAFQPAKTKRDVTEDQEGSVDDTDPGSENSTASSPEEKGMFEFTPSKVGMLKNNMLRTIKIIDCLFHKYNLSVTENSTVDGSYMMTYYESLDIDEQVKSLIISMVDACQYKTITGYYNNLGVNYQDFFKKLTFFRCTEKARFKSCVIRELRRKAELYDLSELDEFPGMSDDEKREFIATGWANIDQTGLWDLQFF